MTKPKKLAFSIFLFVAALGVLEGACRLLGFGETQQTAAHVSNWHETPDGRTFWVVRGPGRNAEGMRDREHAIEKPPGTYRIACLGDSVTLGFGVKSNEAYPQILESFFAQSDIAAPVEVFNIAASGWATLQQRTAYHNIARSYQPDQVFLGFCLNDVPEMHNNLTRRPSGGVTWLVRHSALTRAVIGGKRREISHVRELFDNPNAPAVLDGWKRVLAELGALHDEIRADGAALSVLIFPFLFQVEADAPPPVAQHTLFSFCLRNSIPCLDLLPAFRELGGAGFVDENHLSAEGAARVAREIIRWGATGCVACGYDVANVTAPTCPRCRTVIQK